MEGEWEDVLLGEKIAINPKRNIIRGMDTIFVSMKDLNEGKKTYNLLNIEITMALVQNLKMVTQSYLASRLV
jgi:hypothetical protein